MNRSITRRAPGPLRTAGLVLAAFGGGHVAATLRASPAEEAIIALLVVVAAFMIRWPRSALGGTAAAESTGPESTGPESTGQESSGEDSSGTFPIGLNTFAVVCSPPASEGALAVIQEVIDAMVRPTDFVVRHNDGRLLVLVDAASDDVRESFESRANVHVHVALAAAGLSPVGLSLRPVGGPGPTGA